MRLLLLAFVCGTLSCAEVDDADPVSFITGGATVLCAVKQSGRMVCRGALAICEGSVCRGDILYDVPVEREISIPTGRVAEVVSSYTHACARTEAGELWCWGGGAAVPAEAGDRPQRMATSGRVIEAGVGWESTCVRYEGGAVECWGENNSGQLGDGTTTPRRDPRAPLGVPLARSLSVEDRHACIAGLDGDVWCWGSNDDGRAVPGAERVVAAPKKVAGIAGATQVSVGSATSCALVDGAVSCWGSTESAVDGSGVAKSGAFGPSSIALPGRARAVLHQFERAVAILEDGRLFAWGGNRDGELGTGQRDKVLPPTQFTGYTPRSIALSDTGGCLVSDRDNSVACWGFSHTGALTGRTPPRSDYSDGAIVRKDSAVRWVPMNVPW